MRSILIIIYIFFTFPLLSQEIQPVFQTGHYSNISIIKYSINGDYIISGDGGGTIIIWEVKSGKQYATLHGHSEKITGLLFDPTNSNLLLSCSTEGMIIEWDWMKAKKIRTLEVQDSLLTMTLQNDNSILCTGHKLNFVNIREWINRSHEVTDIKTPITSCAFDDNNHLLVGTSNRWMYWINLDKMEVIDKKNIRANSIHFSKEKKIFYATGNKTLLFEITLHKNKIKLKTIFERNLKFGLNSLTESSQNIYAGGNEQNIYIFNKTTRFSWFVYGHTAAITSIDISPDEKFMISGSLDNSIIIWDLSSHKEMAKLTGAFLPINHLKFSKDQNSLLLSFSNGEMKRWDFVTNHFSNQKVELSEARKSKGWMDKFIDFKDSDSSFVNFSYTQFKLKNNSNEVKKAVLYSGIWNTMKNEIVLSEVKLSKNEYHHLTDTILLLQKSTPKPFEINNIKYNFTIRINSSRELIIHPHTDTLNKTQIGLIGKNGFIFTNENNFYFGTKDVLPYFNLRMDNQLYNIDQFDVYFNRPDLILSHLPFFDQKKLDIVKRTVEKRKNQLKVTSDAFKIEEILKIPQLKIDLLQNKNKDSLMVKFTNVPEEITFITIKVNGVPEKRIETIPDVSTYSQSLKLSSGTNSISISGTTNIGLHTLTKNYTFIGEYIEKSKPDLYIIGIGAGKYKDSIYNLEYAEKDILEITTLLNSSKQFNSIHTKTFTQNEVSSEKLKSEIPLFLENTDEEDVILIFYSGHGVLDKDYEYYLSTYDTDFNNPESQALSYETLLAFTDSTPSRNKVCFIDACHSGEVDKESIQQAFTEAKSKKNVRFRSVNNGKYYNSNSTNESFNLSKQLFNDLRQNNGTIVFSASGGMQFALETDELKNGVFSYAFQEAIKMKKADLNFDKKISLKELEIYLPNRVLELTEGYQNANIRIENPLLNFNLK